MSSRLMSARSRTTGSNSVTGFGIRFAIRPGSTSLANEYISMNRIQSPGYSVRISPSSARPIRLTLMYWPS